MAGNRKAVTFLSFIFIAIMATAFTITAGNKYKNLKVLPQDITERQLDSMMHAFNKALRVNCDFCHTPPKKEMFAITKEKEELDYSLDNQMKEDARRMIKMTIDINKNNFYFDSTIRPEFLNTVSCNTCHRGSAFPEGD